MSNSTYPKGNIVLYSCLPAPISLLHLYYWILFQNYQLPDFFQNPYPPTSNVGGPLHASKLVSSFNLNSSSGLPTDPIIPSPDKSGVFTYSSNMITFLASSVLSRYPDTFYLASSAVVFGTCVNNGGYE